MIREDALDLANELDAEWHGQGRMFEREAVARFWALLTLPARILGADRPREMLTSATVVRNARFFGDAVKSMFFADKDFTEVDALFFGVGSSLGHPRGDEAWVVEVERKAGNGQGDYYVAAQRARKFAEYFSARFRIRAWPVVIYEDDGGKLTYQHLDQNVLFIAMGPLRERTRGLRFPSLADIPGLASDKTLVKLALIRQLVAADPNHPGWYGGPRAFARDIESDGLPLQIPVVGHQETTRIPEQLTKWLALERETDDHLEDRISRFLRELHEAGVLDKLKPAPRLSLSGGRIALRLLRAEQQELT